MTTKIFPLEAFMKLPRTEPSFLSLLSLSVSNQRDEPTPKQPCPSCRRPSSLSTAAEMHRKTLNAHRLQKLNEPSTAYWLLLRNRGYCIMSGLRNKISFKFHATASKIHQSSMVTTKIKNRKWIFIEYLSVLGDLPCMVCPLVGVLATLR